MKKLLDLFCGAGGCSMGYNRAGFEVVGVDINPQQHYPFEFHRADAFNYLCGHGHEFDVIHASPPCQKFSVLKTMSNYREHEDLLTPMREALLNSSKPWIIENVPGAPIIYPMILCGTMFGLRTKDGSGELRRHRLFESNFFFGLLPQCRHTLERTVTVTGHCGGYSNKYGKKSFNINQRKEAMGIDWMNSDELSQAIPPAYTEWIGLQLLKFLLRS